MKRTALILALVISTVVLASQERPPVPGSLSGDQYNIVIRVFNGVAEFLRLEKVTTTPPPPPPGGGETDPGDGETDPGNLGGGGPSLPGGPAGCNWTIPATTAELHKALAGASVLPGQTVCLEGGTYAADKTFVSWFKGTSTEPIIVRPVPGARVVLDGGLISNTTNYVVKDGPANAQTLVIRGAHTWFEDIEITSSATEAREDPIIDGRGPPNLARARGLLIAGAGSRFINGYIHDVATSGIFIPGNPPVDAPGAAVYGTVIMNNGWRTTDPRSAKGHGHGLYLDGNLVTNPDKTIQDNFIGPNFGDFAFQLTGGGNNWLVTGNVIARRALGASGANTRIVDNLWWNAGVQLNKSTASGNVGLSSTGAWAVPRDQVMIRPNAYDSRRARIVIYNKAAAVSLRVDLTELGWPADSEIELRNLFDYGTDRLATKMAGQTITVPLTGRSIATPVGATSPLIPNPYPAFGAFEVVLK